MHSRTLRSTAVALLVGVFVAGGLVAPVGPARAADLPLVDDFESGLPSGTDANGVAVGFVTFNDPSSTVAISTTAAPPAPVPGAADPNTVLKMDVSVVSYAGFVHNFTNAAVDTWVTQDWSAYEGLSFWLYGNNSGTTLFVDVLDNRNPGSTRDDAERWSTSFPDNFSGWRKIEIKFADLTRKEIGNGAPNDDLGLTEVHGWALGTITTPVPQTYYVDDVALFGVAPPRPLTVAFTTLDFPVTEGGTATVTAKLSKPAAEPVTVDYAGTIGTAIVGRDYVAAPAGTLTFAPGATQASFSVKTIDDTKHQGTRALQVELANPTGGAALGRPPIARVSILDDEPFDPSLIDDFMGFPYLWSGSNRTTIADREIPAGDPLALPGQGDYERVLEARASGAGSVAFGREFAIGQDWSASGALELWYYGRGSGQQVFVDLGNDRPTAADPSRWKLAWGDEFNDRAGVAPSAATWNREIGDGNVYGIPGWGNDELQFYTDGTANAATDGKGNLVITARAADGAQLCYYGPCRYTSARLLTKGRFEVAYGRLETRIQVPRGAGLWPAFWALGTNIDQVGWPQAGEIDVMEHVGRLPTQVFGTIHGPGYSGGQSYGKYLDIEKPVADDFHTFAVEWQPGKITWLFDGTPYFTATPDDPFLQGKEWVFDHPFYLLLNLAVGGNFGGAVGSDTTFPQAMKVDYVRVYQAATRPATFRASFRDDTAGWRKVNLPFSEFRSGNGAVVDPANVTSIGFLAPGGGRQPVLIDQLRLACPDTVTVTSAADSGPGSLRAALAGVCTGGSIDFAPALGGETITLQAGPLTLGRSVSIDGSAAPGLSISGNGAHRVFEVNKGVTASVSHLVLTKGYGWQLGGGVLNNGNLTLDHVAVTGNTMATDAGDFWQGGGGIYNGDGAKLTLVDSTVSDNQAAWSGGGVYSFFNTTTSIVRSTISGNVSNDVGGAIRSLGNMTITNSTISGNTATGWHGGAIFHTDGAMEILNSTIANNRGPDWAPSAIFNGSFGGPAPTLTLTNTIISGNQWYACDHWTGANILTSGGHNLVQDDTCSPVASDQIGVDPLLGPLADNGGPTLTHALPAGSPAIDAVDAAACPATDQRGVSRPQGASCDIGSFEATP